MAKLGAPETGLSITRKGNTLTFSWKLGEDYQHQWWQYFWQNTAGANKWEVDLGYGHVIGGKVTSRTITIDKTKWYPNTADKTGGLYCEIFGSPSTLGRLMSNTVKKVFKFSAPPMPSLTTNPSDSLGNTCTFSWNTSVSDTNGAIFTNVEYQSILVANSTETDGSKLPWKTTTAGWRTGTGPAQSAITIAENNTTISTGSHTRWFRVRARGPAGASVWKYGKRVYAVPYAPTITSQKVTKIASGYQVLVNWTSSASYAYPVEENILEYCVVTPSAGLTVPPEQSWTEAQTVKRVGATNSGLITYTSEIDDDKVMFVRVRAVHVLSENASAPKIAKVGRLKTPTIDSTSVSSAYIGTINATNASNVSDSFLVVLFRRASKPNQTSVVGIIPHGSTSTTARLPNLSRESGYSFGVYAAVGSYEQVTRSDGLSSYSVTSKMTSETVWDEGSVPKAPSNVKVSQTDTEGVVRVSWNWTWDEATSTVISWANHEDAWQSTSEPSSYEVENREANTWYINGLKSGETWYIRVRLKKEDNDLITYGPWSTIKAVDLSSAPAIPVLTLSNSIISDEGNVTCFWAYSTGDGTKQAYAEICECTITQNGVSHGRVIAETKTQQHVTVYAQDAGWQTGEVHYLAVRVMSASGHLSDEWSAPVPVTIAEPIYAVISQTNLTEETEEGLTSYYLENLPLTATITGAGAGGTTTLIIERSEDYSILRPDESQSQGYEGETIAIFTQQGEDQITINREDLIGMLDDGASYRLIATIQDGLGQSSETSMVFTVRWENQAIMPEALAYMKDGVTVLELLTPAGFNQGDTYDIYRLTADRPELIYESAEIGKVYVDPFPSIGDFGGHRIVYKTADGDYITKDNELAWIDLKQEDGDYFFSRNSIINFGADQVEIFYDTSQTNAWSKDFKETKYLGGSIQGDWNKGVSRSTTFDGSYVTLEDEEDIRLMRKLGQYTGVCHLRTLDGSSFSCDIQVSETRNYGGDYVRASFSLTVTRIEQETLDGMLYDDYFQGE